MARVGLLGGSFDPPHQGHLKLAELAWAHLGLDELRFVPAAQNPDKPGTLPPALRRTLLESALAGRPWRIEPVELERPGPSFTVDTLETLSAREPGNAWILILGSDRLEGLGAWKSPARLLELAALAVTPRPGAPFRLPAGLRLKETETWSGAPGELIRLPSSGLELASSAIRERLRSGLDPEGVPSQVEAAIQRENLYRS